MLMMTMKNRKRKRKERKQEDDKKVMTPKDKTKKKNNNDILDILHEQLHFFKFLKLVIYKIKTRKRCKQSWHISF